MFLEYTCLQKMLSICTMLVQYMCLQTTLSLRYGRLNDNNIEYVSGFEFPFSILFKPNLVSSRSILICFVPDCIALYHGWERQLIHTYWHAFIIIISSF